MSDNKHSKSSKVVRMWEKRPGEALAHLRRLTGLSWHSYPESLLSGTWIRHVER